MGSHRATRPEVRQTLRARAEAMSLINNIMLLNFWIHCNTNLCAGVRMCFSLLFSMVGDWLARWIHCACYRRVPRCVMYIDAHDSLWVWLRRWLDSEVVATADGERLLLLRAGGVAVWANLHSLSRRHWQLLDWWRNFLSVQPGSYCHRALFWVSWIQSKPSCTVTARPWCKTLRGVSQIINIILSDITI